MTTGRLLVACILLALAFSGCASSRPKELPPDAEATGGPFFSPPGGPKRAGENVAEGTRGTAPDPGGESGDADGVIDPLEIYPRGVYHEENGVMLGIEPRAVGGSFHTGLDAYEPTIGVDSKGRLFVGAVASVAVSEDRGQTFRPIAGELNGINLHAATLDPYLVVDPRTDRLFQLDLEPGSLLLSWTDDVGATWSHNPLANGNPAVNDHPTLITSKPRVLPTLGYPSVLHACVNDVAYTACTASLDGGRTFRPQVPVFTIADVGNCPENPLAVGPVAASPGTTGHLRAGPDGSVYLPVARCASDSVPVVAVSGDDGLTWTTRRVTVEPQSLADDHDVDVAIGPDNHLFASWNSRGRMLLSRSTDGGATWSRPYNITAPGITGTAFNAIGSAGTDLVAVAYLGTQIPAGYEGKGAGQGGLAGEVQGEPDPPEWAGADWHALLTVVDFKDPDHPRFLSVTGNPVDDPLARGLCGRTRCHGMADFIDLFVDRDGRPWASFVDVCNTACAKDRSTHWDAAQGLAVTLLSGPSLRDRGALPRLDPQRDAPTPSG